MEFALDTKDEKLFPVLSGVKETKQQTRERIYHNLLQQKNVKEKMVEKDPERGDPSLIEDFKEANLEDADNATVKLKVDEYCQQAYTHNLLQQKNKEKMVEKDPERGDPSLIEDLKEANLEDADNATVKLNEDEAEMSTLNKLIHRTSMGMYLQEPVLWLAVRSDEIFCLLTDKDLTLTIQGPFSPSIPEGEKSIISFLGSFVEGNKVRTRLNGISASWFKTNLPQLYQLVHLIEEPSISISAATHSRPSVLDRSIEADPELAMEDGRRPHDIIYHVEEWVNLARFTLNLIRG